jgi:glutathione S-transferase
MSDIEFITYLGCPFAQRTHLVLEEKAIAYRITEIDLGRKPDWFLELSPYGKVPVLRRGADAVFESAIINEYLEELFPTPPLLPADPGRRATARFWIDFANVKLTPTWYKLLLAQDRPLREELKRELGDHFLAMERDGIGRLAGGGPYWMGPELTLVDIAFYPWFERLPVMATYRDFRLSEECPKLKAWAAVMAGRPSVKKLSHPPEYYIRNARKYADGTASGATAEEMRKELRGR